MRKKVLGALILSVCMIITLTVMNVSAASETRTATINVSSATVTEGSSETITVDITLNRTINMNAIGYKLKYDTSVFELDTALAGMIPNKHPAYIDDTWYKDSKLGNIYLFAYLGKPVINADTTAGEIIVGASSSTAVDSDGNEIDALIGKFYLKVKSGAAAGTSQITLIEAETADLSESFGAAITVTPVTFTVESDVDLVTAPVVNSLGAQIRTTGIQGLRFGTKLTKNDFFKGIGLSGSDKNGKAVTDIQFGTLILPTAYLGGAELTIDGVYGTYTVANVLGTNIYEETPAYIVFTAVLTGIPAAQYDTSFTARAYVKYKLDGVDQIVYFAPIARTVNGVTAASMQ